MGVKHSNLNKCKAKHAKRQSTWAAMSSAKMQPAAQTSTGEGRWLLSKFPPWKDQIDMDSTGYSVVFVGKRPSSWENPVLFWLTQGRTWAAMQPAAHTSTAPV
jgi:hypothetical protein